MKTTGFSIILAALGIGMFILAACGDGQEEKLPTSATQTKPATAAPTVATAAPAPTAASSSILERFEKAGVGPYELDNIHYGGTHRTGGAGFPAHLDPKLNRFLTAGLQYEYEKLAHYVANENDEYATLLPILVEKWDISSDVKAYTITLRKGVKWQNLPPVNGREFVADDVLFNIKRYSGPDSIEVVEFSQIESAEAPDKYTVVIKLKEPNAFFMLDISGQAEYMLAPEFVKETGDKPGERAIGTGPYILKEFSQRTRLTFVRNPDYWGRDRNGNRLPYTDQIDYTLIADTASLVAAFRTGQIDIFSGTGLTESVINVAKSMPDVRLFNTGIASLFGLSFVSKNPPWDDVRMRRALNMALDKEKYKESFGIPGIPWMYYGGIPWSLIEDRPITVEDMGSWYKYNPTESKRLRTEAGFPESFKFGTPIRTYPPERSRQTALVQQLLKAEGIELQTTQQTASDYQAEYNFRRDMDISIHHQKFVKDYSLYTASLYNFSCDSQDNKAWICDPEVERVIKQIKVTTDPVKTKQFARFLWDFEVDGSYNIWMPVQVDYHAVQRRVRNYTKRWGIHGELVLPWLADAPRTSP